MNPRDRYPIPARKHRVSDEVKGSRFIATVGYAPTAEEARDFVDEIRREFADATHNCWAFVVGPPGSTRENGAGDDGEPGGTAGMPILGALLNSGVGDVVVVVTRYYGGVKLGRGGLVRAYGGGARRVLRELPLAEKILFVTLQIRADYAAVEKIRRVVHAHGGNVAFESFDASALFEVKIPAGSVDSFEQSIREATAGKARFRRLND